MSIQVQRKQSGLPCATVYGLYRALPGDRALFVTVACEGFRKLDASIGASGPHDFAIRNIAVRRAPKGAPDNAASTAPRPNVRDDGQRPFSGRDSVNKQVIWVKRKQKYF